MSEQRESEECVEMAQVQALARMIRFNLRGPASTLLEDLLLECLPQMGTRQHPGRAELEAGRIIEELQGLVTDQW